MSDETVLDVLFWAGLISAWLMVDVCASDLPLAKYVGVQIGVLGVYVLGVVKGWSS